VAVLALAPSASALTRYVDAETGSNADPECSQATPCQTVMQGVASADPNDVIAVDNGGYAGAVTLGSGMSLEYQDFVSGDGTNPPVIDGGAGHGVEVISSGAGHIRGFALRGDASGVTLNGPAEVDSNTFNDATAVNLIGLTATAASAGSVIHDNAFIDLSPVASSSGVGVYISAAVEVRDNTIQNMNVGVFGGGVGVNPAVIEGNIVTGTHNSPTQGRALSSSNSGPIVFRENAISGAEGLSVTGISPANDTSLIRNSVTGHQTGVFVGGDYTDVSLNGDRIWGNTQDGIQAFDNGANSERTSVTATGVTSYGNGGVGFRVESSDFTLDSSIVDSWSSSGTAACTITFSRGDTTGDPSTCDDFQTTADPMFVNAANGDFHLLEGSPMIDAGNPAAPPTGDVDFDGDDRALDGTPECSGNVQRRDIGADEFAAPLPDCIAPDTSFDKTPPKKSKRKRATFRFSADDVDAVFECKLDDKAYKPCTSPYQVRVKPGRHTVLVAATDLAGNVEDDPASYRFRRTNR
jgi:hypothetical protein